MKRVTDGNLIFQQYSALMLIALNTVQLLQCKTPIFLYFLGCDSKTVQSLTPMMTRFGETHSSNSMSC